MLSFTYYSPTRFVFGPGKEKETGALIQEAGSSRVLLHYGGGSVRKSGLLARVTESLEDAGLKYWELGGVQPNPRDSLVYEGIDLCRREKIDFVLGLGGGSAVDSAKAIAIGTCYEGDFWDLYGGGKLPEKRLPMGTIVTLPATGTEGSNSSVIKRVSDNMKRGLRSDLNRPDFSIINPELTYTLPAWQIACGAADILSHIFERYFTREKDVILTDNMCEAVIASVIEVAPLAIADKSAYGPRANLMWSSTLAHNGLLELGRQGDWSAHALEHELSGVYDTAHGAGLAALYPAWLEYHLPHDPERLARLAHKVFSISHEGKAADEVAREGIRKLASFYRSLGLPVNLSSLGIKREDLPLLAARVKRNPDGTCGHYLPLQDKDILAIYEKAYNWSA